MTGRDLLSGALRLIGVLASGEAMSSSEATDGLAALNDMLDSWSTENLLIPNKVREVFPLVANQQAYTMGTGGNFNTIRPIGIEKVLIQISQSGGSQLELPMKILTEDQFASITLKQLQSPYPMYVYAEGTYPLETLNFWAVPTQVNNVVIYSAKPLLNISNLNTVLSVPPGYQRALRYCLAVELAPEYGRAVPEVVFATATDARANIKRQNSKPNYLTVDEAIQGPSTAWNWYTGGFK